MSEGRRTSPSFLPVFLRPCFNFWNCFLNQLSSSKHFLMSQMIHRTASDHMLAAKYAFCPRHNIAMVEQKKPSVVSKIILAVTILCRVRLSSSAAYWALRRRDSTVEIITEHTNSTNMTIGLHFLSKVGWDGSPDSSIIQ